MSRFLMRPVFCQIGKKLAKPPKLQRRRSAWAGMAEFEKIEKYLWQEKPRMNS